jgi:transketolase
MKIFFFKKKIFDDILKKKISNYKKSTLISLLLRVNILSMIKNSGSGHIGTSFSALDLMIWIKFFQFKVDKNKFLNENRHVFFSSKGHDAPALYSILFALGYISFNKLLRFRKLNGLEGHPDIDTKGIEANTGSLGMGISKAKGISWAKNYLKVKGFVIVLIGDGEFQEGQIFESLQSISHQKNKNLIIIMDHNKVQSSDLVKNIVDLGDVNTKIKSFGWNVLRINGHNFKKIHYAFRKAIKIKKKPVFIIADTIKGKGVSFMEHPIVIKKYKKYLWHSGAPTDDFFISAQKELFKKIALVYLKYSMIIPKVATINLQSKSSIREKTIEFH